MRRRSERGFGGRRGGKRRTPPERVNERAQADMRRRSERGFGGRRGAKRRTPPETIINDGSRLGAREKHLSRGRARQDSLQPPVLRDPDDPVRGRARSALAA